MTSSKPYLIRAIHEWIVDNQMTPYVYVNTGIDGLSLPEHLYADDPLILNIAPVACQQLQMHNDKITFQTRFSGRIFSIVLPVAAVIAIVARENGQGMTFDIEEASQSEAADEVKNTTETKTKRGLKIIK